MTNFALESGNRTIVAFGDSTTALRDGVEKVYSDLLRDELPSLGITGTVINKGIPGNNTNQAMARFQADVLDQSPDLVVIQFGINDQAFDLWETPPATDSRVSLAQYRSNLTHMIETLKNAGIKVILMTSNPIFWTDELKKLYGSQPYNADDRMGFSTILKDYAQAVREIASTQEIPLVDVFNLYLKYDQVPDQDMEFLLLDGMHPNAIGHRMVANSLMKTITGNP